MIPHPWSSYGMHGQNEYANGTPTVPSELTGYRRWTLRKDGLVGNFGQPWGTEMQAQCLDKRWVDIDRDEYLELFARGVREISAKIRENGYYRAIYGEVIPDGAEEVAYTKAVVGRGHDAPHHNRDDKTDDCKCGIYAGYSINGLQEKWLMSPSNSYVGVVKASGHTICGKVGFRTARARIVALCVGLDATTEQMFHQGKVSKMYIDPATSDRHLLDEEASSAEQLRTLVGLRAAALERVGKYSEIKVYDDIHAMIDDFPPDDLSALGIR
jgi:hypothetical protein